MSVPPGAMALLAGAVSYALSVCGLVTPGELALPTPCAEWDLGMLLAHLSASMADLEAAISTGQLDLDSLPPPPQDQAGQPVELIRDRAAGLLCAVYGHAGPERFVTVGGLPLPAGLVACTGAVEIAVHGWDVAAARGRAGCGRGDLESPKTPVAPIPAALAIRMLRVCPLLVVGREGLFALPVEVPAQASPGDRLVGYLGRDPGPGPRRHPPGGGTAPYAPALLPASSISQSRLSFTNRRLTVPRTARDVVFVDGVRTPFGKAGPNGLFAETRADDMVVAVIRELLRRNPALPPGRIGEVAIAATIQTGDQGLDARMRLVDFSFAGVDPEVMGIGPIPATEAVLARYGLTTMCVGLGMGGTVLWENLND